MCSVNPASGQCEKRILKVSRGQCCVFVCVLRGLFVFVSVISFMKSCINGFNVVPLTYDNGQSFTGCFFFSFYSVSFTITKVFSTPNRNLFSL